MTFYLMTLCLMKKRTTKIIAGTFMVLYYPFYFVAWCLHKVVRLALAVVYLLLLDTRRAYDIVVNLFTRF